MGEGTPARVALVTGGAPGIGAAVVRRWLAPGHRVASLDIDVDRPVDAHERHLALVGDVADEAASDTAVRRRSNAGGAWTRSC